MFRRELEEKSLQTAEFREREKEELKTRVLAAHPITIVRIRFTNRYILQGSFPTEGTSVGKISDWLKSFMATPTTDFYLCMLLIANCHVSNSNNTCYYYLVKNILLFE